jgi:hypothetical protein
MNCEGHFLFGANSYLIDRQAVDMVLSTPNIGVGMEQTG